MILVASTWGDTRISSLRAGTPYVRSSKYRNDTQFGDSVEISLSGSNGWAISSNDMNKAIVMYNSHEAIPRLMG